MSFKLEIKSGIFDQINMLQVNEYLKAFDIKH